MTLVVLGMHPLRPAVLSFARRGFSGNGNGKELPKTGVVFPATGRINLARRASNEDTRRRQRDPRNEHG